MKRTNKISRRGYSGFSSSLGREARVFAMATFGILTSAFLTLTMAPLAEQKANATTTNSEVSVGVEEVLSLRILKYDEEQHDWVDTSELSTTVRNGYFAAESVRVVASTNGSGGYTLSLSDVDNDTALTSTTVTDTIPALTSSVTVADVTDSTNLFPQEKWGYSWAKGETASLTFQTIPQNNAAASAKQKDVTNEVGANTYTFSMGVKVGEETPAETYQDQVMFTVVGNPSPTSPLFFRTTYMQDFTTQICNTVDTPGKTVTTTSNVNGYDYVSGGTIVPSTIVKDRRDEQEYIVRKLADGNCWMTENLRLGKNGAVALTSENSDLTSGRTFDLPAATTTTGTSWGNQDEYPFVFYRDSNPGAVNPTVKPAEVTPDGPSALYNWYTATAGAKDASGNSLMTAASGQAADSVCPKGWQLPVNGSGYGTSKSYMNLVYTYTDATANSWATTTDNPEQAAINAERIVKLLAAPTSFVYSDFYNYGGTLFSRPIGLYWSSSVASATNSASLNFHTDGTNRNLYPQNTNDKGYAFAVRCVVR